MTELAYLITDLGPGDGGKGGVVHALASLVQAHVVLKEGGAQGNHGLKTSKGESFAFSQWGCGTLEGIPTHITDQMVVSPIGLLNEADALRYQCGIYDAFSLLTIDENALCATPFHGIASRLKEMARGDNPRGTIGTGVGEAYRDLYREPELALFVRDLKSPDLRDKLAAVREHVQAMLLPIIQGEFLAADREEVVEQVHLLFDDSYLQYVVERFYEAGQRAKIVSHTYLAEVILPREGNVVVETSHGVLTDRVMGFHPHTSAIRTLPSIRRRIFDDAGYEGQIVNIGVHRAYTIRHGAGPVPTADPDMSERLLPGSHKDVNRYQGEVRVGALDLVLLRYALAACGGPSVFDSLAISWFDQIQLNQSWETCNGYANADDPDCFTPSGDIRLSDSPNMEHQTALTQALFKAKPEITARAIDSAASRDELFDVCAGVLNELVNVPVRMVSFGPTELDKLCK